MKMFNQGPHLLPVQMCSSKMGNWRITKRLSQAIDPLFSSCCDGVEVANSFCFFQQRYQYEHGDEMRGNNVRTQNQVALFHSLTRHKLSGQILNLITPPFAELHGEGSGKEMQICESAQRPACPSCDFPHRVSNRKPSLNKIANNNLVKSLRNWM